MLAEWISLLGLDGDQPPWDGEPRMIRAKTNINGEEICVRIINLLKTSSGFIALIEEYSPIVETECRLGKVGVNLDKLKDISIIY